jgi:outer membrane protein OmpA-like peptidoglycan-associated protein
VVLKGIQMKSGSQIDMPGAIDFETGSAKIKMTAGTTKVLSTITQVLKDNPNITTLSVEGNTDNAGEPKFDNKALSQGRAQAVVDYLTAQGIDKGRLQAVGNGSSNPLAPNDTPAHMALNRRVEFHVLGFNGQAVPKETAVVPMAAKPGAAPSASGKH